MDSSVDWSNLPVELWPVIGKNLKIRIEILRFRSVCSSWRFFLPPFHYPPPPKFPLPFLGNGPGAFLSQNTVHLVRPATDPNPSTSSSSSSRGWLVKLEECGKLRLWNPMTCSRITRDASSPEAFNLLEFNMVQLSKSCVLKYVQGCGSVFGVAKVILMPPGFIDGSIMVIFGEGKLGFAVIGDQQVTVINHAPAFCDDILVYDAKPYVVDNFGCVYRIEPSLEVVRLSSKLGGVLGGRKHLVESGGELYVVHRCVDQEASIKQEVGVPDFHFGLFHRRRHRRGHEFREPQAVDFKVYRLEMLAEQLGTWDEVKSLDDQAFFLSMDCTFAVSANELAGCKGNCIYFTDQNDLNLALREVTRPEIFVFNLEDHSIQNLGSSDIFWPPAAELSTACSQSVD